MAPREPPLRRAVTGAAPCVCNAGMGPFLARLSKMLVRSLNLRQHDRYRPRTAPGASCSLPGDKAGQWNAWYFEARSHSRSHKSADAPQADQVVAAGGDEGVSVR